MTRTLAAVYAPIGLQGGLTGALFREFAFTLAGAVIISGVVALTLSPMMSAKMLKPGLSEHGLAGRIERDFNRFKGLYGRLLNVTLDARPAVYLVWLLLSLAAIPMFIMSPAELAPKEDQGAIFSIVEAPASSTLELNSHFMRAADKIFQSIPETDFTFEITFPTSGFGGLIAKPWDERKRSVHEILTEVQQKMRAITGIRLLSITPSALPGGGDFPVEFIIASTAEHAQILDVARQLQLKAIESRMFAFPPIIDVKIDQPQSELVIDRDKVARSWSQSRAGWRGCVVDARGQLCQPFQHCRPQLQGYPADQAQRPPECRSAPGYLYQPGPRASLCRSVRWPRSAIQPLPAL